ncbi:ElyC/SanA/YdcF family protein [Arthrobacter sp. NPDC090010]|uniref:ElyC/SanA/YdcF family protein n=1 Tax=Arthrobacter sp. NPDC090010 TaxID=3363942 RepID=UPI0037F4DBF0
MRSITPFRTLSAVLLGAALVTGCTSISPPTASAPTPSMTPGVSVLLQEARTAFDSPQRISTAGNTDKTLDNMAVVEDRLLKASSLAPLRADLLFSAASARIARGNVRGAITLYQRVLDTAPSDEDALSYLASWSRQQGDSAETTAAMNRLRIDHPNRATELQKVFKAIDYASRLKVSTTAPEPQPGDAVVTLGYALNEDGSMAEPLLRRLEKTLELARAFPAAKIVVTGGVEKAGKTEAISMKNWLVDHGIDPSRILAEDYARSTVENALYSSHFLASIRAQRAILISSGSHVQRGTLLLGLAAEKDLPASFNVVPVAAPDNSDGTVRTPAAQEPTLSMYRDALSVMGLWSYRSAPLLQR